MMTAGRIMAATWAALLVLPASAGALADRDLEVSKGRFVLRAAEDLGVSRRTGLECVKQADLALRQLGKLFGLDEAGVFFVNVPLPWWMPDREATRDRITLRLRAEVPEADRGWAAYVRRMAAGSLEVVLPAPGAEEITDAERFRIRAEVAEAVLAQSVNDALPLWLRAGLPLVIAEAGGDGADGVMQYHRTRLAEGLATLAAEKILCATKPEDLEAAGGAAGSWALIRLLTECEDDLVPTTLAGCWELSSHVVFKRPDQDLLEEFTDVVVRQLESAGADRAALADALRQWVRDGFPAGAGFRTSELGKSLRDVRKPALYTVAISAQWMRVPGSGVTKIDRLQFSGGSLAWRLPWEDARVDATIALVKEGGVNYFRATSPTPARGWESGGPWQGKANGQVRLAPQSWADDRLAQGWGIVFAEVRSPRGLRYLWYREAPIR